MVPQSTPVRQTACWQACTVTVETAALLGSARLVATTWQVPLAETALNSPDELMEPQAVPSWSDQDTPVSAVPVTVPRYCTVPLAVMLTADGTTRTDTPWPPRCRGR